MPVCDDGEVLIRVVGAGVCEGDLRVLRGEDWGGYVGSKVGRSGEDGWRWVVGMGREEEERGRGRSKWNGVPGMEIRGVVESVGRDVFGVKIGEEVVCNPYGGDGVDEEEMCGVVLEDSSPKGVREWGLGQEVVGCKDVVGVTRDGGWQQFVRVPKDMVFVLSRDLKKMTSWSSLVVELALVVHGFSKVPLSTKRILIFGQGGIGDLFWALFLREKGLAPILCNDHSTRRRMAKDLKFDAFTPEDITAQVELEDECYDVIIECTGRPEAIRDCLDWVDPAGTILRCAGLPDPKGIIAAASKTHKRLVIESSFGCSKEAFTEAMYMATMFSRKISPAALGVQKFSISDYGTAIQAMRHEKICKALFFLTDPRARRFLASPGAPLLSPSNTPYGVEIPQLCL